jgi:Spy/CpxP family protein refolding chaperone
LTNVGVLNFRRPLKENREDLGQVWDE